MCGGVGESGIIICFVATVCEDELIIPYVVVLKVTSDSPAELPVYLLRHVLIMFLVCACACVKSAGCGGLSYH